MAEPETEALADEVLWREKAMWLLIREMYGGEVTVSKAEWEAIPDRPEIVIAGTADGGMRWTARDAASPVAAELAEREDGLLPFPEAT